MGSRLAETPRARLALATVTAITLLALATLFLDTFTLSVLTRAFLFAVAVLTVDVLWGYTGILSFGQGAFFGIGAYAAAMIFTYMGLTPGYAVLALFAAVAAAALVAALVGWLAFWHGATSFYIAVVTLVLPIVVVQLIYSGGSFTGSSSGLVGFPAPPLSTPGWFFVAGLLTILAVACALVFVRSDFGHLLKAIRDNEERCRYLGINTSRLKILLLMAMAAVAAVAGYIHANSGTVVAPENAGFVFGTVLVIYAALGGRASILGPVIATVLLEWVSAYLRGSLPFVWNLIIGSCFLLVIVTLPQGLLPTLWRQLERQWPRLRHLIANGHETASLSRRENGVHTVDDLEDAGAATSLELHDVGKHYGHLQVLSGVDLSIRRGELVGVVGPNGAGKTTLMRCISDGLERSSGTVRVNGAEIGRRAPSAIVGLGLGRSFQHTSVIESLTVAECLRLARYRHLRPSATHETLSIKLPASALEVLERTELIREADKPVRDLSHGMKRALELAMVLALEPSVVLLDEPTAGLTKNDREMIGDILVELRSGLGLAIVLIEHDFEFVRRICSRLVVLHQGELLLDGGVDEVVQSSLVQDIYSGQAQ